MQVFLQPHLFTRPYQQQSNLYIVQTVQLITPRTLSFPYKWICQYLSNFAYLYNSFHFILAISTKYYEWNNCLRYVYSFSEYILLENDIDFIVIYI